MAVDIKIQTVGDDKAVASIQNITAAEQEQKKAFEATNKAYKESRQEIKKTDTEVGKLTTTFKKFRQAAITAAIAEGFRRAATEITKTTVKFKNLETTLQSALGSKSAARQALADIRQFAADTPLQVDDIASSFNGLANRIEGIEFKPEQFQALGDFVTSQNKQLPQLTEAILDVSNTERWTELGVKVRTEGDKIVGTFKGVTQTFDKTEQGALEMAVAFGQMEGVTGVMTLQAAELGGKLSNLEDNTESLKLAIGTRLAGAFSDVVDFANRFVSTINDYLEIPLSQELIKEQAELNALGQSLLSTADEQGNFNEEEKVTASLIEEINQKYPALLSNISEEELNVTTLRQSLAKLNQEYIAKIALQQADEEITKAATKAATTFTKRQDKLVEVSDKLNKIQERYNVEFGETTDLTEKYEIAVSALKTRVEGIKFGAALSEPFKDLKDLQQAFRTGTQAAGAGLAKLSERYEEQASVVDILTQKKEDLRQAFIEEGIIQAEEAEVVEETSKKREKSTIVTKSNNDEKERAIAIARANLELQRSEVDFLLKKNQNAQANTTSETEKQSLLNIEFGLRQRLIEIQRQEVLLTAKLDEQKKLANQNAKQSNDLLEDEIVLKKQAIEVSGLETIEVGKNTNKELAKLRKQSLKDFEAMIEAEVDAHKKGVDIQVQNEEQKAAIRQRIEETSLQFIDGIAELYYSNQQARLEQQFAIIEQQKEDELVLVGNNEKGKELVEERANARRNEVKRKQAIQERNRALFNIAIDTAVNAVKLFGQTVPPGILSAFAIGQGLVQAGIVRAAPLPKFFKGTEYLERGNNPAGRDTIPILANEGERIVPTAINQQLKGISNKDLPKMVELGQLLTNSSTNSQEIGEVLAKVLDNAYKKQPRHINQWDADGVKKWIVRGANKTKELNNTFKL